MTDQDFFAHVDRITSAALGSRTHFRYVSRRLQLAPLDDLADDTGTRREISRQAFAAPDRGRQMAQAAYDGMTEPARAALWRRTQDECAQHVRNAAHYAVGVAKWLGLDPADIDPETIAVLAAAEPLYPAMTAEQFEDYTGQAA